MDTLLKADGSTITQSEEIVEEVHHFCLELYSPTEPSSTEKAESLKARNRMLAGTHKALSTNNLLMLEAIPTYNEVRNTIWLLPSNKAPGPDGLTAEVFRSCWDFIKEDFMELICEFWLSGVLPEMIKEGLIRLIPKKADKKLLKNWRPLTMLNTTYKILAKLLANRLKKVLPTLISRQQTGFIPGRYISENISIAWLTIDWVPRHKVLALFLKLDFEKAFDKVDHSYIWDTMHLLGIGSHFIKLVKALLTPASSIVQVNGHVTKSIGLSRGVR